MEITKGEWEAKYREGAGWEVYLNGNPGRMIASMAWYQIPTSEMNEDVEEANAKLIAEAGTVYNETGYSPRELADRNVELLEASTLLYNLLRKIATVIPKTDFDVIRPDWNRAMNSHENAIQKSTKQQLST